MEKDVLYEELSKKIYERKKCIEEKFNKIYESENITIKKVIQDLTNILLDEEKINFYSELFGLAKEYIIYTRTKLLKDLTNYYIDLNYQKNVTDFKGIAFDNETFKFDNKYKLSYVELIYIRFYIK